MVETDSKYAPEHILHQGNGFLAGGGYDGGEGRGRELGELEVHRGRQLEA